MTDKHIVAGSGGFIREDSYHAKIGPILRYALELTGKKRPKFAYIGTATGDDMRRIASFYGACSGESVEASHLELFPMPNHSNLEKYILNQDIIWVGGGSVANLLAVWRVHGLDTILRKAWEQGTVLSGQSAGAICWSAGGTTDSFAGDLQPVTNSLELLPFSCGVHYDTEPGRRPLFHKLVREQIIPAGYATDDGVNIHYVNNDFKQAISDTTGKRAYYVSLDTDGKVQEDAIEPLYLATKPTHPDHLKY